MIINNHTDILSQSLSQLTYNGEAISVPQEEKLNLYMGIGLWSAKDGLSIGLPIDAIQMLLSAAALRAKILAANPQRQSKVIILIADGMAIKEGANFASVAQITAIYKRCLEVWLHMLHIAHSAQLVLSSELDSIPEYQEILLSLKQNEALQKLEEDKLHYHYIQAQTAITAYMHLHQDVGVKVGWICKASSKYLAASALIPDTWDELKFDRLYSTIYLGSRIQYLYAKAGLKQIQKSGQTLIAEGCPYTAYPHHQRWLMNTRQTTAAIGKLSPAVLKHWKRIIKVCASLKHAGLIGDNILPNDLHRTNEIAATQQSLNYWLNLPIPLSSSSEEALLSNGNLNDQ